MSISRPTQPTKQPTEYYQVQHKQEEQIRPSRKARDKRTPTTKPKFNINQMNNNPHLRTPRNLLYSNQGYYTIYVIINDGSYNNTAMNY